MKLTTRCPECQSSFEISPQQLQLRKGYIRCIYCAHIFDGYEAVVPDASQRPAAASVAPTAPPTANQPAASPTFVNVSPPGLPADNPVLAEPPADKSPLSSPAHSSLIRRRKPASGAAASAPAFQPPLGQTPAPHAPSSLAPGFSVGTANAADEFSVNNGFDDEASAFPPDDSDEPSFAFSAEFAEAPAPDDGDRDEGGWGPEEATVYLEPRQPGEAAIPGFLEGRPSVIASPLVRFFWSVLLLLGFILAAAQLVYIYRVQIASGAPFLRPLLEQACQAVSCTVDYPRKLSAIAITATSLKAQPEASRPDRTLVLDFVLHNRYQRPQQWPVLALDLKDAAGAGVARLLLGPEHYLSSNDNQGPFPAQSQAQVSLPFSVQGVTVAGYQLTPYFP